MTRAVIASFVAGLAIAAPAAGQSLFNAAGIGLPVEALDARARALGNFGLGLSGATLLPSDPAAAARLLFPTGVFVAQPSWVDFTEDGSGQKHHTRGSRFPLLGVGYPVGDGIATLQLTSFLDQRFDGERPVTVTLAGGAVPATDVFDQDGSVSTLTVGYARMLNSTVAVGLTVGRYAGTVDRRLTRDFGTVPGTGQVSAFESSGAWRYSGELVTGGVSADVTPTVRVAASVTWSTDLAADGSDGTLGADRSYDLPLQLRVGASGVLAPGLSVSASAVRADWSALESDLSTATEARSTTGFGVGLELTQTRLLGRQAPLRLGYRRNGLPFSLGSGSTNERTFSGGLALTLNETEEAVLATADFALERGKRSGGGFTENFWRGTVSVRVAAF